MYRHYVSTIVLLLCFSASLLSQKRSNSSYSFSFAPTSSAVIFERPTLGDYHTRLGVNVQLSRYFSLSQKISLGAGINYSLLRAKSIDYTPVLGCDNGSDGLDVYHSWYNDELTFHYIGIPVEFRFMLVEKTHRLYTKIGYAHLFLLKDRIKSQLIECAGMYEVDLDANGLREVRRSMSEITVGIGVEFKSESKAKFFIEPEIGYLYQPFYEESFALNLVNNISMVDMGLKMGVRF